MSMRFIQNDVVKMAGSPIRCYYTTFTFPGYNNQEVVSIEMLMPSHGMEARARQVIEARSEQPEDSFDAMSPTLGGSDWMPSPDSMGMYF